MILNTHYRKPIIRRIHAFNYILIILCLLMQSEYSFFVALKLLSKASTQQAGTLLCVKGHVRGPCGSKGARRCRPTWSGDALRLWAPGPPPGKVVLQGGSAGCVKRVQASPSPVQPEADFPTPLPAHTLRHLTGATCVSNQIAN